MSGLVLAGLSSGSVTLDPPAIAGSTVIALPDTSGTLLTTSSAATGTGDLVKATAPTLSSPVLVTPNLGTPSAVVLTNATGTANALVAGIGVNQTWQNVTASRAAGTTYTNSTGKPIMVSVTAVRVGSSSSLSVVVGGVTIFAADASSQWYGSNDPCFIVPAGATYVVTSSTGFRNWAELR